MIINPDSLARPSGYSHGIKAEGTFLAIAGQVVWDREGRIVGDDFVLQFAAALNNVVTVVKDAGGTPQNIVSLMIFVTDKRELLGSAKPLGAEYRRIIGRHFPAMTLVEVKGLIEPGAKVEIQDLAVL